MLTSYLDDVQCLLNAPLLVKREGRIDLSRHFPGYDLQNLTAELHQEVVEGGVDLLVDVLAMLLSVLNRLVDELGVFGLLGGGEDQRWVGRGILRLILVDGGEVARVTDNGLSSNRATLAKILPQCRNAEQLRSAMDESTRTVPVALSWSRDEDMVVVVYQSFFFKSIKL